MEKTNPNQLRPSGNTGKDSMWGQLSDPACLTPEVFDRHVGDVFRVTHQLFESEQTHTMPRYVADGSTSETHGCVELKLIEVARYAKLEQREGGFGDRSREPFALLFVGPLDAPIMSAEHAVHHDQLGSGRFFFTATQGKVAQQGSEDSAGLHYEIVFG